jgi:hypothetical protein
MCCTSRKLVAQQVHNSGGKDAGGVGQHRRLGRHNSTSSATAQNQSQQISVPSGALPKKKDLTNSSYI